MMTKKPILSGQRKYAAEFLGSCLLTMVVIGSGIAAQQFSPDQVGLQLLENSIVTGAGLFALISLFSTVSGAHFNPVVTLSAAALNGMSWREVPGYCLSQVAGCIFGAVVANYMFSLPLVTWSQHNRINGPHFVSEILATAVLLLLIFGLSRSGKSASIPAGVASYITAAYFFTSSTSFANPAITVGRMFTNSFTGIAPSSAPGFVLAQLLGAGIALLSVRYFFANPSGEERL
jgi:glycerol uptake facilitator-like aquaporin